jgi:hypothetical protein
MDHRPMVYLMKVFSINCVSSLESPVAFNPFKKIEFIRDYLKNIATQRLIYSKSLNPRFNHGYDTYRVP